MKTALSGPEDWNLYISHHKNLPFLTVDSALVLIN